MCCVQVGRTEWDQCGLRKRRRGRGKGGEGIRGRMRRGKGREEKGLEERGEGCTRRGGREEG
eukprot:1758019-Rhodomonas_salina.2